MSFEFLGLSDEVLAAVKDAGYEEPTPIQRGAIPAILQGRDVLGIAQTGTGKTAGFTLPLIDILAQGRARARMPRSLILEPTRELAAQVDEAFETYGKYHKLTTALLIGGVSFGDQNKRLDRGVDVLIATPGRLLDHFERGRLMLTGVEILIIDEADRMLDMGFIPDVERICKLMPQKPQTLFFSATMPPEIQRLSKQFLNDPKKVEVARPATTAENVTQYLVNTTPREKEKALEGIIRSEDIQNGIIFCNRKVDLKALYASLKRKGFDVVQLHGDMAQSERMQVLQSFKDGKVRLLMASDVAARGLDIPAVSHVINYDVPMQADDYVHRIGRTGRAGRSGKAFTIATRRDQKFVEAIEKLSQQTLVVVGKSGPAKKDTPPADKKSPEQKSPETKSPEKPASAKPKQAEAPKGGKPREDKKPRGRKPDERDRSRGRDATPDKAARDDKAADGKAADGKATGGKVHQEKSGARKDQQKNKPKDKTSGDDKVVGWGDSMPAFMSAPTQKK